MSDTYLVGKISEKYPWIDEVYRQTSGYIHLSEKHFWNAMKITNKEDATLKMKITDADAFVTEEDYIESVTSFRKSTDVIFDHVSGWVICKEDPKKAFELQQNELI
jgi:adenylate kinase family enzyme